MIKKTEMLDVSMMENWLWDAACTLRGPTDAPKYKDFILPLIFYKRLSDVFDDEFESYIQQFGDKEVAHMVVQSDHYDALKNNRKPMVRFYIPIEYSWSAIRHFSNDKQSLGEFITEAMRAVAVFNPDLQGVLDVKDYNERQSGQRTIDDDRLAALIEIVSRHRLGLKNAEPDILGRAYEYLLRKFAEGQGQSAGEFFTPKEVGWLMARILDPKPRSTVYDPTCGSAGLLIKARLQYEKLHPDNRGQAPKLFGQEQNPITFAMAKMNMFLHDFMDCHFAIGDTFTKPGFVADGTGLKKFDYVIANPMWNQDIYTESFYSNDPYKRFEVIPPNGTADWAWVQHIWSSLNDNGRAAIVLDTGAISRGSGSRNSNKERDARKLFIEQDRIEGVILLPDNLFYNTTAPGIILFLNKNKSKERKGQVILINANSFFNKEKPKNALRMDQGIDLVVNSFKNWSDEPNISKIINIKDISGSDYNISPSQFITASTSKLHRGIIDILAEIREVNEKKDLVDEELSNLLNQLNLS